MTCWGSGSLSGTGFPTNPKQFPKEINMRIQPAKNGGKNGDLGLSENVVYPIEPNGFADHYAY